MQQHKHLIKTMLHALLSNVYNLGMELLTVPDGVRDCKPEFNHFIFGMCSRIARHCQEICEIDDEVSLFSI